MVAHAVDLAHDGHDLGLSGDAFALIRARSAEIAAAGRVREQAIHAVHIAVCAQIVLKRIIECPVLRHFFVGQRQVCRRHQRELERPDGHVVHALRIDVELDDLLPLAIEGRLVRLYGKGDGLVFQRAVAFEYGVLCGNRHHQTQQHHQRQNQ